MKFKNGTHYESNYARAAAYFLSTCAEAPDNAAKKAAHSLITGIYKAVYDSPEAIGWKKLDDVWFEPWEKQNGREGDTKAIRGAVDKIEALVKELFEKADSADVVPGGLKLASAPSRPLQKALAAAGYELADGVLPLQSGCAEALKALCEISKAHIIHITDGPKEDKAHLYFSRCVFEPDGDWNIKAFDNLINSSGALVYLCCELEKRGYKRIDCRDGKRISLDYVKQHGNKEEPVKMSWADKTHSGIEVTYEELRLMPCFVWLRMPAFKTVLENAGKLPEDVRKFVCACTKTCDGCRYCVQTDKTKTRPLSSVPIDGKRKCPLYPSFSMNWRELDAELASNLLKTLDAVSTLID